MTEDIDIIHSSLEQTCRSDGHSVRIQIYRNSDSQWVLEGVMSARTADRSFHRN